MPSRENQLYTELLIAAEAELNQQHQMMLADARSALANTLSRKFFEFDITLLPSRSAELRAARPPFAGLNGEFIRAYLLFAIMRHLPVDAFVETGTFYGATCMLVGGQTDLPIYSCDIDPVGLSVAANLLKPFGQRISLSRSESPGFLRRILTLGFNCPLFYLDAHSCDAHWNVDFPLRDELEIIVSHAKRFVLVIDDCRVPNDPQFGHDPSITEEYFGDVIQKCGKEIAILYPNYPAKCDTGARRGWAVITTENIGNRIANLIPAAYLVRTT